VTALDVLNFAHALACAGCVIFLGVVCVLDEERS
jgi:hypothetical protein